MSDQAKISCFIKNVDTHHESFKSKKQVTKKLSPKSLWQTYMKWTVGHGADSSYTYDIKDTNTYLNWLTSLTV